MENVNCKNCGASEFKDGKCAYCGTDYGFTGDIIQDGYLLALKRKRLMNENDWNIKLQKWTEDDKHYAEIVATKENGSKIKSYEMDFIRAMDKIWFFYCQMEYTPKLEIEILDKK